MDMGGTVGKDGSPRDSSLQWFVKAGIVVKVLIHGAAAWRCNCQSHRLIVSCDGWIFVCLR